MRLLDHPQDQEEESEGAQNLGKEGDEVEEVMPGRGVDVSVMTILLSSDIAPGRSRGEEDQGTGCACDWWLGGDKEGRAWVTGKEVGWLGRW